MIDFRTDYQIAINKINNWKISNERQVYLHRKLLTNLMFRAICTKFVFDAFKKQELPHFNDINEALEYIEEYYRSMEELVSPNLISWLRQMPNDMNIGTVNYHFYKCLAFEAEESEESMKELEYIYVFEQLNDACVLFYISWLITGCTIKEALESVSGTTCSNIPNDDLLSIKEYFQPIIADFMSDNYK